MNKQQFLHMFHEALRERGVDVDELMNKHQSETAITVHWTDGKIRTGYVEGEDGEVLYLKAHVQVGDKYIADDKYDNADDLMKNGVLLGCHQGLTEEQFLHIESCCEDFFEQF